ncbi:hypothetical protein FHS96_004608 [Sphingomonas zeicaulis]
MKRSILTSKRCGATRPAMAWIDLAVRAATLGGLVVAVPGCIQVTAPEKPIEINLNINVKQEVLVKLQQDAEKLIEDNPELFPQ